MPGGPGAYAGPEMATTPQTGRRAAPWRHLPVFREPPGALSLPACRLADGALFAFAVVLGGVTQGYLWHSHGQVLDWVDVAVGVVACVALWWRRAHTVAVFVVVFASATFSPLALGAGLVAVGTAASRARGRALIAVVVMSAAASVVFPLVNPSAGEILRVGFPAFLLTVIAFGWGLYLRARRELSPRSASGRSGWKPTSSAALSRPARRSGGVSHGRCTTCWPIGAVHAGDGSLSPAVARRLISLVAGDPDTAARQEQARRRLASLTPREHQVAAAIAQGHSNADIAAQLHMSLATVKAHVSRLLAKLSAGNRVQIALLVQDATASHPPRPQ